MAISWQRSPVDLEELNILAKKIYSICSVLRTLGEV